MKTRRQISVLLLSMLLPGALYAQSSGNNAIDTSSKWTWMSGKNGTGRYQIDAEKLGTKGTPYKMVAPPGLGNWPGTKNSPVYWKDTLGQLYFFGGHFNGQNTFSEVWRINPEDSTWTWVHGPSGYASSSSKGKLVSAPGVPDPDNVPESRYGASFAVDSTGCVWMFGGYDNSTIKTRRNDLWRYNPYENEWTYYNGSTARRNTVAGVYGTQGVPDTANQPGARGSGWGAAWVDDKTGKFYLFSGNGVAKDATETGYIADFWVFDMKTALWTWIGGGDSVTTTLIANYGIKGQAAASNFPQPRADAATWKDKDGNFWMFGGTAKVDGNTYRLNDMWKYNPGTNMWTWIGGDKINSTNYPTAASNYCTFGVYGTRGVASPTNYPGGRSWASTWVDADGNFWLFGGHGLAESPDYISRQNDMWKYNPTTNEWTWINGSKIGAAVASGTPGNYLTGWQQGGQPGGRSSAAAWADDNGNVWIFTGAGGGQPAYIAFRSDLWMLEAVPQPVTTSIDIDQLDPSPKYCLNAPVTVTYTANGTYNSGNTFTVQLSDENGNFTNATDIGTRSSTAANGTIDAMIPGNAATGSKYRIRVVSSNPAVTGNDNGTDLSINPMPTLKVGSIPSPNDLCEGETIKLFGGYRVTGGPSTTYQWDKGVSDGVAFPPPVGQTTYTVIAKAANCSDTGQITVIVNELPEVTATSKPDPAEICAGDEVTLNYKAGLTPHQMSYTWDKGVNTNKAFKPGKTETYTITAKDKTTGCVNTDSIKVTVHPLPAVTAKVSPGKDICEGNEVTLSGDGAATYEWNHNVTDGKVFVPTQTETYTVTGTDANGCKDSADITITVKDTAVVAIADTICSGDVYTLGTQNLDKTGIYTEIFVAANGCDSTITLDLTVNAIDLSITQNGNELKAADGATAYQWLDCEDNQPIPGATQQTYSSDITGDFAVVIAKGDCTDTSVCYHIEGTNSITDRNLTTQLKLYPNPAHDKITIRSNVALNHANIIITNMVGRVIMQRTQLNGSHFTLDLQSFTPGVYYLKIVENDMVSRFKFVKK